MSPRAARWIAVAMLIVGGGASIALLFTRSDEIWLGLGFTAFLVVGIVLAAKRPEQPIGWLLAVGSVVYLGGDVAASLVQRDRFPGWPGPWWAGVALWVAPTYYWAAVALLVPLPALLFPTGSPLSPRWRIVVMSTIVGAVLASGAGALAGVVCVDYVATEGCLAEMAKPLGVGDWLGEDSVIAGIGVLLLFASTGAALLSVVVRFRRSRGAERAQMKWFALGVGAAVTAVLVAAVGDGLRLPLDLLFLYSAGIAALPVSVAVAIFRYHLYDIDRIVSRTVTYALVIGLMAIVFVSLAVIPTIVVGSAQSPSWLIAASTLVAFALFDPMRRRVQRVVDRRFNRLPYDPETVGIDLAAELQNAVDPATISISWLAAIERSLQPVNAAVWVKDAS